MYTKKQIICFIIIDGCFLNDWTSSVETLNADDDYSNKLTPTQPIDNVPTLSTQPLVVDAYILDSLA